MNRVQRFVIVTLLSILSFSAAVAGEHLRLATTTSTENSGVLALLLPPFEQANCMVDAVAVGTGKAIKLGENGGVDVVMAHAWQRKINLLPKVSVSTVVMSCTMILFCLAPTATPPGLRHWLS